MLHDRPRSDDGVTAQAVASENSIRPDRHLIGLFSALLVGRENSLFFEKIPCYGSKNSLFRCVGNFSAKH
jgi:hypothetical protein